MCEDNLIIYYLDGSQIVYQGKWLPGGKKLSEMWLLD